MQRSALVSFSIGAAAVAAAFGSITYVIPYVRSDNPPFASTKRVEDLATLVTNMTQIQQKNLDGLNRLSNRMDNQELDNWNAQAELAAAKLKSNPNDELAKRMAKIAHDQIFIIQSRIVIQEK